MAENNIQSLEKLISDHIHGSANGKLDICPIYKHRNEMKQILAYLAEPFAGKIDYVAAPESIGFILGTMMAETLEVGFIPIRNGSLSYLEDEDAIRASYIDHRDTVRSLHMRKSNFPKGSRILIVDDWVNTAATMQACSTLIELAEGTVVGIASLGATNNAAVSSMIESGKLHTILIR